MPADKVPVHASKRPQTKCQFARPLPTGSQQVLHSQAWSAVKGVEHIPPNPLRTVVITVMQSNIVASGEPRPFQCTTQLQLTQIPRMSGWKE